MNGSSGGHAKLSPCWRVRNYQCKAPGGACHSTSVSGTEFDVANHCPFWDPAKSLDVPCLCRCFAPDLDALAYVHSLRSRNVDVVVAPYH